MVASCRICKQQQRWARGEMMWKRTRSLIEAKDERFAIESLGHVGCLAGLGRPVMPSQWTMDECMNFLG